MCFGVSTYSQDTNLMVHVISRVQNVVFKTTDSCYNYQRFINQYGRFHFGRGGYSSYPRLYGVSQSDIKSKAIYSYQDFVFIKNTDTIKSYLPITDNIQEFDTVIEDVHYTYSNLFDELEFSYILRQLGEPNLYNSDQFAVRLLYPYNEPYRRNDFLLIKFIFFSDSVKLYSISTASNDFDGIKIKHIDSCFLSTREIRKIKKQLILVQTSCDTECRVPGTSWLLECNSDTGYNRFIISDECKFRIKKFRSISDLTYLMIRINFNHFKDNDSNRISTQKLIVEPIDQ